MAHASVSLPSCRLSPGQFGQWRSRTATLLVVEQGRAWVTIDAGPDARAPRGGDWFLDAGAELPVAPRRRLLIEPLGSEPVVVRVQAAGPAQAVLAPPGGVAGALGAPWRWAHRAAAGLLPKM